MLCLFLVYSFRLCFFVFHLLPCLLCFYSVVAGFLCAAQQIQLVANQFNLAWTAPIQIAVTLYLLYNQIGCVLIFVCYIPLRFISMIARLGTWLLFKISGYLLLFLGGVRFCFISFISVARCDTYHLL